MPRTGYGIIGLAGLALATTAAEVSTGPSVVPPPAVAILHGTYDQQRHQQEHDAVLTQLGWTAVKYALTDLDRLVAELDRFDVVLGNPLFNYGPDTRDFTVHAAAWRRFLERGGAVVLTDCNYPGCVNWLGSIASSCAAATEPCRTDRPATEATPPHPLHSLPCPVVGRNSWQHLVLARDGGWEVMTRCGDGQATAAAHPLGAGLLVLTSNWPARASELENLWANLRLRRVGLAATHVEFSQRGPWEREALLGLRQVHGGTGSAGLRLTIAPVAGDPRMVTTAGDLTADARVVLRLSYRLRREDDGSRARLCLEAAGQTLVLSDVTLSLPPLLAVETRRPAYRGTALASAWPGELALAVVVTPDAETLAEFTLNVRVTATDRGEVAHVQRRPLGEPECEVRLPLPGLAAGAYTVRTELWRGDAVAATVEQPLLLLPDRPGTVLIDERLNLLVDGKPFFPLGMYHVGEADLPAVAALGINTVQGWGGNLERARRFLDAAQANGLKVLLEMGGMVDQEVHAEAIAAHVRAFRDHPALLAWYVRDEPSPAQQPLVREAVELFHRLDATHPTYMVSCRPGEFAAEARLADIFAVDPYPLPGGAISMVSGWAEAAWKATRGTRPVWLIPQAHDQSSYDRKAPERGANPPTTAQERCMVYQCLAQGAKGIVWYTWDDGPNMGAKYHPAMQAAVRELCAEIGSLAPLLLRGTSRRFDAAEGKVRGLVCMAPTGGCLLVVNTANEAVTAAVDIEEAAEGQLFTPVGGGAAVAGQGRRLLLQLPPLGAQAYVTPQNL